jgi:hypothetical protein
VLRRVRPKPARRLLELAFAADAVAAAGLIPGDRDVNEALEEVALLGRRGPPRVFEFLVGGKELLEANELQTAL